MLHIISFFFFIREVSILVGLSHSNLIKYYFAMKDGSNGQSCATIKYKWKFIFENGIDAKKLGECIEKK